MAGLASTPLKRPVLQSLSAAMLLCATVTLGTTEVKAQAAAAPPPPGTEIETIGYAPISAGAAFELQANSDDELTQTALARMSEELANHGYAAQDDAPLVMQIETNLVRGEAQDDPLGQVHANNDDASVQARLFSTTQNSLLNPRRPIGSADRIYRINVAVYDRQSGLYVWRGTALRNDPNLDITQASNEMISALVGAVGRTVQPSPAE